MTNIPAEDFSSREKRYVLAEFPYPSGSGLHIGHTFTFTGADAYARYLRMAGKNVLFPIGWDAFGLPTENYAIRSGRSPVDVTRENTQAFERQMRALGFSFDWPRLVNTTDPDYYKWTQWIFIQLYKHGLASKQEMPINWCPKDKIGLANEEVIDGRCERCGTPTERRLISQWVIRITAYAERLLSGLEQTEFIEKVKAAQVHWIGRSAGAQIRFDVEGQAGPLTVFTTRPDTLWGCTFLVLAPEHPLSIQAGQHDPAIAAYLAAAARKSDQERAGGGEAAGSDQAAHGPISAVSGVFSGLHAIHPATGEKLPVWISDFVLAGYGSGAIMAVPAHDERDHAFARRFDLPIHPVIVPPGGWDFAQAAYSGLEGVASDSGPLDGLAPQQAIPTAIAWLEQHGLGEGSVSYHLRDWIFSRQHYWGEPIPMIYCAHCGWNPVPESDLPVLLPVVEQYQPTDTGESPLANIPAWVDVPCPVCSGPAQRETDTMPNWAGSDWYFLRYIDPHNAEALADMDKLRYWLPVDVYVGGDEHNTLHLLYSRFIYQFLWDIGAVPKEAPEPYRKRLSHGVILGADGARMSKSRGNVITPDVLLEQYGADVVRTYLLFMGPYDATLAWNERAVMGVRRFLDRFERWTTDQAAHLAPKSSLPVRQEANRLARSVGEDLAAFKFNTAVAKIMESLNWAVPSGGRLARAELQVWVQCLAPFAPFAAEAAWQRLGLPGSVHASRWPAYDPALEGEAQIEIPVQVNGKLRGTLLVDPNEPEEQVRQRAIDVDSVRRFLDGKEIRKVIYAPGRAINFVV